MSPVDDDLSMRARGLPKAMEPERDLWPEIEAALSSSTTAVAETAPVRLVTSQPRWQMVGMAAGLLLAAVLGFWLGDAMDRDGNDGGNEGNAPAINFTQQQPSTKLVPVTLAASLRVTPDLDQTRRALAASIYDRLASLPPDTREVVAENLGTINRALDDIDRALSEAPASGLDGQLLMSMYVDQLGLLTAMNRLIHSPNQELTL